MTALSRQQFRTIEGKLHACFSHPDFVFGDVPPPDLEQAIWCKVSLWVYNRFQDTGGQALFKVWFGQPRQTVDTACEKIPLGKSMFLQWRERIVLAAALYAAQLGVFRPFPPQFSRSESMENLARKEIPHETKLCPHSGSVSNHPDGASNPQAK